MTLQRPARAADGLRVMCRPIQMLPFAAALAATVLLAAGATAQCLGGNLPCHVVAAGNVHDGNGGPFLSGHAYVVTGPITVPSGTTLTVQPGAVVKFAPEFTLPRSLYVLGRLVADGTAAQPIVFTSWSDDTAGGDTNGDGSASSPAPGDWKDIAFESGSGSPLPSSMTHCQIRYGGRSQRPLVYAGTSDVSLTSCTLAHGLGFGIETFGTAKPTVAQTSFQDLRRAFNQVSLNGVHLLTGNTATAMVEGDDNLRVWLDGGTSQIAGQKTWTVANSLNQSGVFVLVAPISIAGGNSLTLGAGCILKAANQGLVIGASGALHCNGNAAAPVVFTDIEDDAHGGDTTNNGSQTPARGSWKGVVLGSQSSGSSWTHAMVLYAGFQSPAAVQISGSDPSLDHVTFGQSFSAGLTLAAAHPTVSNSSFVGNQRAIGVVPIDAVAGFSSNTASGNVESDALAIGSGTLGNALTLGPQNALGGTAFELTGDITVGATGVLTLQAGTVIKGTGSHTITVSGVLDVNGTNGAPVVFTSIHDDQYGGDTNNNGGATSPAPGDWDGIVFQSGAAASTVDGARVRYAGNGGVAAVRLNDAAISLTNSTIEHSEAAALGLAGNFTPAVSGCAFDDNGAPPIQGVRLTAIGGFTNNTASNNVGGDTLVFQSSTLSTAVTLDAANTLNQTGVFVLAGLLTIAQNGALTLQPGAILKIDGNRDIVVYGTLTTTGGPVIVTSLDDDTAGGDTANDGPTTGTPGDWGQINLQGSGSSLSGLDVRFGGSGNRPMVIAVAPSATFTGCRFASSGGAGLALGQGAMPTVSACAFEDNAAALEPVNMQALGGFSANTATGNAAGDFVEVSSFGGGSPNITPAASFNGSGVFVISSSLSTSSGQQITVAAGVVLKSRPNVTIAFSGPVHCAGTAAQPVVMTSIRDDTFGGDTNGDGNASSPAPGDWNGVIIGSAGAASLLEHTVIRYAGANGNAAVELFHANVTMVEVIIEYSAGDGIDLNGTAAPTITGGAIRNNGGLAIAGMNWDALGRISGVSASGNAGGDSTVIDSATITTDVVVYPHSYFGTALVVNVSPLIGGPGTSITLMPGVIVKFPAGVGISFRGRGGPNGTARDPVVLTSLKDDTWGGDTNGDGNATSPQPGDWIGVENGGLNRHALVRYAGEGGAPGFLAFAGAELDGCRVEHALGHGFHFQANFNGVTPRGSSCIAWSNGGDGFHLDGGQLWWCTAAQNGGLGVGGGTDRNWAVATNSWANTGGNFPALTFQYRSFSANPGWWVMYSNGITGLTPCPPPVPQFNICMQWGWNNLNVDPQFVNLAQGDLRLQASSQLIGHVPDAETFASSPASNFPWVAWSRADTLGGADALDHPRILDPDVGGPGAFRADVGAYEFSPFVMTVTGETRRGTTMTIQVDGPPGLAVYSIGLDPYGSPPIYVGFLGWFFGGSPNLVLTLGSAPTGSQLSLFLPNDPGLVGFQFGIQALAASGGGFPVLTNAFYGEIF